jgi:threonine/homoserine/homoserine lactone efflux protein
VLQSSFLPTLLFAFSVSIGAVVSPGPVSAAILTETPRRGWQTGPLIATGHILLELIFISLISIGLSTGLAQGEILRFIAIGGSLLLFYMGASYLVLVFRKKAKLPVPDQIQEGSNQNTNLVILGMLTTISNPFWYAWWVTVVPGYLGKNGDLTFPTIAAFYLGHISVDYFWDTILSAVIFSGRRWLNDRSYRILIFLTGGFMIYLGFVFLQFGISYPG